MAAVHADKDLLRAEFVAGRQYRYREPQGRKGKVAALERADGERVRLADELANIKRQVEATWTAERIENPMLIDVAAKPSVPRLVPADSLVTVCHLRGVRISARPLFWRHPAIRTGRPRPLPRVLQCAKILLA
jgi:hypothetical protein